MVKAGENCQKKTNVNVALLTLLLKSYATLLSLDREYPDEFSSDKSIDFDFESCGGFELMDTLLCHTNSGIF